MSNVKNKVLKRQRELEQRERVAERAKKQAASRAKTKTGSGEAPAGGDPDIDWIVPGPQPPQED